jgi:PAS domain S-box-containing protein
MNPAAETMLGWTLADLQGPLFASLWDVVNEDGSPLPGGNGPVATAFRTSQPLRNSVIGIRHRDGERRWLQLDVLPAVGSDGSPSLAVCTFLDITARKSAEEALQDSETRYRLLFDRNPHPMWVLDNASLAFLAVNEAAVRQYGYTRDEFLATTARFLRPPNEVAEFVEELTERRAEVQMIGRPWRHRKKDGTLIHVEVDSHRLVFLGRDARMAVVTDVTERKRAEEALAHQALHDRLTASDRQSGAPTAMAPPWACWSWTWTDSKR